MNILLLILGLFILYVVIQMAIDHSLNTTLLRENNRLLIQIRDFLKNIDNK